MNPVRHRLEPLELGALIVSDIFDPSGHLLLKAPAILTGTLKDHLRIHGIREVFVDSRSKGGAAGEKKEIAPIEVRLSLLGKGNKGDRDLKVLLVEAIEQFGKKRT